MILGVHGMEPRVSRQMAVEHLVVVVKPVSSQDSNTVHGPGGMTPQVAANQQILNLLPAIGGPQLLSLRQVLHDAHGQLRNLPENFGGNVSQPCMGVPQFGLDQGHFISMQNYMSGQQQQQQNGNYDVFAKSEKWIGNPPRLQSGLIAKLKS